MIVQDRAIILKAIDFQESSKILTVLTETHGKIALIAKGAKRPKSKLAGILETGNILDVVYYYKSTRSVQTLSEATTHYASLKFRQQIERTAILYASLELLAQLVHDNEVNIPVFEFTLNFLKWLGDEEHVEPAIFAYVQIRLAEISGIGLHINPCVENRIQYLNISSGNISEEAENELAYRLTTNQAQFLDTSITGKTKAVLYAKLENEDLKQLVHHLDVYFKYHIDGYQERKSDSIFEQMLV